jgi:hypothetical protein
MGRDGPCGFCGKKMLNCWIFIVGYLHNVEREDLPAALCSIAYGGSTLSRKLHRWLSGSGIATLLMNGSLKPCRSSEGNGNDVRG